VRRETSAGETCHAAAFLRAACAGPPRRGCQCAASRSGVGLFSQSREVLPQRGHDLAVARADIAAGDTGVHEAHRSPLFGTLRRCRFAGEIKLPQRGDAFGCADGLVCIFHDRSKYCRNGAWPSPLAQASACPGVHDDDHGPLDGPLKTASFRGKAAGSEVRALWVRKWARAPCKHAGDSRR